MVGKIKITKNQVTPLLIASIFALLGVVTLLLTRAATQSSGIEAESGQLSGGAVAQNDVNASGGKYVKFTNPTSSNNIFINRDELMAKPTTGAGWTYLKSKADLSSWGIVNLADQDSKTQTYVLAGALVYARTGDNAYKDKVVSYLKQVCGTETDGTDQLLNLARTLYGYVVSADLVGVPYTMACNNGQTWQQFLEGIRTKVIPGNSRWSTLEITSADTSSNWGAYALSSHLAVSYALNDTAAIQRDLDIFKRVLGDTTSSAKPFNPTSSYVYNNNGASWDMTPTMRAGINPPSSSDERAGALIEDALRSVSGSTGSVPCCTVQQPGIGYQEEALDGMLSTVQLFRAHGIDVVSLQSNAIKRAYDFYLSHGGSTSSSSSQKYQAYAMNYLYGASYPTQTETTVYRHLGYGSWIFAK